VNEVLNRLNAYSYRAYIVGKCVRELIGGQSVVDFDIITDANTDRICAIFDIYNVNTDNIDKGEVIVIIHGLPILIMPYTGDINDNLKQREFSFNAIAYNPREGFVDPFGGVACLTGEQGIVSVIEPLSGTPEGGEPSPFERNPVSILQALGYYASGDYVISPLTRESILFHKGSINMISAADLRTELSWVLRGRNVSAVLEEYAEVFTVLVPEFAPLAGFALKRPEHSYDALTHAFKSVGYASPVLTLRYAMLFHNLGMPDCHSEDKSGKGHYYGHAERSWILAHRIMRRLGFSEDETREVGFLIKNQSTDIASDRRALKLKLREMTPERLKMLLQFRHADLKAQSPEFEGAAMACKRQVDAVNEIVAMKECYTLHQLAINRYDLMQNGAVRTDEHAGLILERLLDMVIDSPAFNTRAKLLGLADKIIQDAFVK
jgi:tRNA nucleotidyltransferase (CCA-adding enzyme)